MRVLKVKNQPISVRFDTATLGRLQRLAAEDRRSVSNVINLAVEDFLRKKEEQTHAR